MLRDHTYDWASKKIAVLGNGSSALQVIPALQPKAAQITNYIRSPTWVSVNFAANLTPKGENFEYTEEQKETFREDPDALLAYRKNVEHKYTSLTYRLPTLFPWTDRTADPFRSPSINEFFWILFKDSPQQKFIHEISYKSMMDRMADNPQMAKEFIPDWQIGCRRLSPGAGYLEALQAENGSYTFSPIVRLTEKGILTADGKEEQFDLIVMATGFDVSYIPSFKLVGRNGRDLGKMWAEDPEAYFSMCASDMPNYFMISGPNAPIGHGGFTALMSWSADYILKWCRKIAVEDIRYVCLLAPSARHDSRRSICLQEEQETARADTALMAYRSVTVSEKALQDYNAYSNEFLKRMVWSSGCRSWYKGGKVDSRPTAVYAGSALHFKGLPSSSLSPLYTSPLSPD